MDHAPSWLRHTGFARSCMATMLLAPTIAVVGGTPVTLVTQWLRHFDHNIANFSGVEIFGLAGISFFLAPFAWTSCFILCLLPALICATLLCILYNYNHLSPLNRCIGGSLGGIVFAMTVPFFLYDPLLPGWIYIPAILVTSIWTSMKTLVGPDPFRRR